MDGAAEDNVVISKKDMEEIVHKLVGSSEIKVIDVKFGVATSEVSGFLASHTRSVVTVEQQGKEKQYTFFIKSTPEQESQKEFVREYGAFETEIGFYTQIIPQVTQLGISLPYPLCYLARNDNEEAFLVLEDLAQSGYKMADKKRGLDCDHCLLVVQELAKLHAGSVALEQMKQEPLGDVFPFLRELIFNPEIPKCFEIVEKAMDTILVVAKRFLPHLKDSIAIYESRMPTLQIECKKLGELWPVLNVTCHGDLWINNLLFAYENKRPLSVKLLDLQLGRYGPPTVDLIVFLWVSTVRSFREEHEKILLQKYYESFCHTLNKVNVISPEAFTFDALWDHYKSRSLLGLCTR